jgi:hypothetical protein
VTTGSTSITQWLRQRLTWVFGLDTRSLAVARIALGLLVLLDVWVRLVDYGAFYTESGVLSRAGVIEQYARSQHISLFMASGADWWAGVCFAIEAAAAACFLVGYRTRLANWIVWFMVIGTHARMSFVLQSGDVVLRLLLFWSLFLPMGARFSLDNLRQRAAHASAVYVVSVATIAIQFQVAAIYIWSAVLKTGEVWNNGEAVYYALSLDHFSKQPITDWILSQDWLWRSMTHTTFALELYGTVLLLIPVFFGPIRSLVVLAFIGLHLGFWATMELGLFPWISIVGWLFLLPGWFWERIGLRTSSAVAERTGIIGLDWAGKTPIRAAIWPRYILTQVPALFCLWLVFQWNMMSLPGNDWTVSKSIQPIAHVFRLDQRWSMFAPYPIKDDGWYTMPGKLVSGEEVDLWQGGAPKWATEKEKQSWTKNLPTEGKENDVRYRLSREKPPLVSAMYSNQRWRKYMRKIWLKKHRSLRLPYGQFLCREWNGSHRGKDKLKNFKIIYMKEQTPPPGGSTEVHPVMVWSHDCFSKKSKDKK